MAAQLGQRPSRLERRVNMDDESISRDRYNINNLRIDFKRESLHKLKPKDIKRIAKNAYEILGKKTSTHQSPPTFPALLFSLVLIKNLTVDIAANLTVIGTVAVMLLSVVTSILLFFWYWGKTSTGKWKERLLRWLILAVTVKFMPIINIIPSEMILILIVHYRETKAIRLYNLVVTELKKTGALDRII